MGILCSRTTAVVKSMRQSCLTRIWTEWGLQSLCRSAKKLCATVTVRTVHGEEINATPPLTLYVILKRRKNLLNLLAQAKKGYTAALSPPDRCVLYCLPSSSSMYLLHSSYIYSSLQAKTSNTTGHTDHIPLHVLTCTHGKPCQLCEWLLRVFPEYLRVVFGTRPAPYPLTDPRRSDQGGV